MPEQNPGNRKPGYKSINVNVVKKLSSNSNNSGNSSVDPFDFEPLGQSKPEQEIGFPVSAMPRADEKFAVNKDVRISKSPSVRSASIARGFSDIEQEQGVESQSVEFESSGSKLESDFYGGIDDMNNKRTGTQATASRNKRPSSGGAGSKTAAAKRKAAAQAAALKKQMIKRQKLIKKVSAVCVAIICISVVSVIGFFAFGKVNSPYLIQNGFAELNEVNLNGILGKGVSDLLASKTIQIEVDGESYPFNLKEYGFGYAPEGNVGEPYIQTEISEDVFRVDKISSLNSIKFNETAIREFISRIASKSGTPMTLPSYQIEEDVLKISVGKNGMSLDYDQLITEISNRIYSGKYTDIPMEIKNLSAPGVDIDKIYKEVKCDPKDASVEVGEDGVAVYIDEIVGKDFDLENAREIVSGGGSEWSVKLFLKDPAVTVRTLKAPSCPDVLSSNSTKYAESNVSRSANVKLAGEYINGLVLQPGEIFSFNKTVGERTPARGFKSATVYSGEGLDEGYGGGICQTSSTVYYAAVKANLAIAQRVNHYFTVGYWNLAGADATVSWGGPDLKIKNDKEYPIKFVIESGNGKITCKIMGTKTDNVEAYLESEITKTISYQTVHKDPVKGKSNKNTSGANGLVVNTYRVVKRDGEVVSRKLEAKSTYRPLNAIIYDGAEKTSSTAPKTTTTKPQNQTTTTKKSEQTTTAVHPEEE